MVNPERFGADSLGLPLARAEREQASSKIKRPNALLPAKTKSTSSSDVARHDQDVTCAGMETKESMPTAGQMQRARRFR
jgi:hypothetical protein